MDHALRSVVAVVAAVASEQGHDLDPKATDPRTLKPQHPKAVIESSGLG